MPKIYTNGNCEECNEYIKMFPQLEVEIIKDKVEA